MVLDHSPGSRASKRLFRAESRRLFVERARFLLWSVLVLYPAFWLLDLAVAPERPCDFLAIRAAVCCVYVSGARGRLLPFRRAAGPAPGDGRRPRLGGRHLADGRLLGGFTSNYFAGNIIVIFMIGFFLPWEPGAAGGAVRADRGARPSGDQPGGPRPVAGDGGAALLPRRRRGSSPVSPPFRAGGRGGATSRCGCVWRRRTRSSRSWTRPRPASSPTSATSCARR